MENKLLEELLKKIPENQYIGLGNPNSKILFIGKEAGAEIETEMFHGSAKSWKEKEFNYSEKYVPEETKIRNLNHTWQRYQKLYDCILSNLEIEFEKKDKYEISFVENIFTTELSNLHAPNTTDAKKQEKFTEELKSRKDIFFKSNFIKQFPIVVIFASDNKYIETYQGEVCELFNVKFDKLHNENAKDKIWIHSETENDKNPRLVIHTRQLTNSISVDLIPNICELIVEFIKEHSIK
ncbi:hypothetical protein IA01_10785 [Flavobacterium psychrophilum]|uniref:Uncharacterized protein n=1 Tax=Flavobacterium psychrophilum (strain ATCC 49511 / DSM 21280 / CIP 103535 / JIP02/86) TaxID=402612 RepID=A6H1L6_FLAPJ|nr:hypothetical protein [Flavobacterium psychrophilum]AIG30913.1 hypothetical protein IA03_10770 [Flavobacterium psychrophilum]AIG33187.1 hypothetical protein IA01_10785 [Flavobacterium psychrophilum]AIG35340.1 hypothetical protein IA02_10165 [Flavobacterium psychrophilum]AIG37700.1 hypothetical protein IA04_10645 [Flavobacterium psychrophilum]AIG39972.1 hypothetical protein IA05_10770 [Flavobacterium psychrophilum]